MEKTYELIPADGRKSFYGKTYVVVNSGVETLYSYGTPVMRRDEEGNLHRLWDGYSMTTQRHINAFCGMNKREYMKMEVER